VAALKIFCVHDSKIGAYLQPFFMRSVGEAIRGFEDVCNNPETQFNKYPADFTLFEIGGYDDLSGTLSPLPIKVSHGLALDYLRRDLSPKPPIPISDTVDLEEMIAANKKRKA